MKLIVQKFGGTSVASKEKRDAAISKIKEAIENGFSPVVVVSAMGRRGEPYATDTLLNLIGAEFAEKNLRATDLLLCCGEIISTVVMSNALHEKGIDAMPLTGGQAGISTDSNNRNAAVLNVDTKNIIELAKSGKIPVVAGFQGMTTDGVFTTLGRGASDYTAVLLGAALNAEFVEIYTDVDGIMTADPRVVEDANLIDAISYNEVFELAEQGAKVIHPRAVEEAMKNNVKVSIRNTMSSCKGTLICSNAKTDPSKAIIGLTHIGNRAQISVKESDNIGNENYRKVLTIISSIGVSIDLINVFKDSKVFTIDERNLNNVLDRFDELNLKYEYIDNCSKVTVVGYNMHGRPGIMAAILSILSDYEIEILQTADSHMNISCLVKSEMVKDAIKIIHKEFGL